MALKAVVDVDRRLGLARDNQYVHVFIFLPRAACAVDQFLFFTARSLHGGNHVLLVRAAAAMVQEAPYRI
jgi:hypothetical protein